MKSMGRAVAGQLSQLIIMQQHSDGGGSLKSLVAV